MIEQDLVDYFDEEAYDDIIRGIMIESLLSEPYVIATAHPTIGSESYLQIFMGDGNERNLWLGIIKMDSVEHAKDEDAVYASVNAMLQRTYPDREIPPLVLELWSENEGTEEG